MGLIVFTGHHAHSAVAFLPGLLDCEPRGLHLIVFYHVKPQVEWKHFNLDHTVVFPGKRKVGLVGESRNDQSADVSGEQNAIQ